LSPVAGLQSLLEADNRAAVGIRAIHCRRRAPLLSGHAASSCHWPEIIDGYALHRCQLKKDDA